MMLEAILPNHLRIKLGKLYLPDKKLDILTQPGRDTRVIFVSGGANCGSLLSFRPGTAQSPFSQQAKHQATFIL